MPTSQRTRITGRLSIDWPVVMTSARERWRLFDHDVDVARLRTASVLPTLEELVAQPIKGPTNAGRGFVGTN